MKLPVAAPSCLPIYQEQGAFPSQPPFWVGSVLVHDLWFKMQRRFVAIATGRCHLVKEDGCLSRNMLVNGSLGWNCRLVGTDKVAQGAGDILVGMQNRIYRANLDGIPG